MLGGMASRPVPAAPQPAGRAKDIHNWATVPERRLLPISQVDRAQVAGSDQLDPPPP